MFRTTLKTCTAVAVATASLAMATPSYAAATTVVVSACDPVTDGDAAGCLFNGNINGSTNTTADASYINAQNAYNGWADEIDFYTILLNYITKTDDGDFGDFGTFTGANGLSGTFDLSGSGFVLEYYAVKYGNQFTLYEYLGTDGTGSWVTNGKNGMSHIAFFGSPGTAVPEPATWAMMLLGFGAAGTALRRSRRKDSKLLQIA
jgi:hypothetical protein